MRDWRIVAPERYAIGFEGDHLVHRLSIRTDAPAGWSFKLDAALGGRKNVIDLNRDGDTLWVELTRDMLPEAGLYRAQVRGLCGEAVRHSGLFYLDVGRSIGAVEGFPEAVPSELAQMEARMTALKAQTEDIAAHPPKPGEGGVWQVWDPAVGAYVDSGVETGIPQVMTADALRKILMGGN